MAIDWSQKTSSSKINWNETPSSKINWNNTPQPVDEKNWDVFGGLTTFVKGLSLLPKQIAASVLSATQGQKGASVVNRDWADKFIENVNQDAIKFIAETAEKYGESKIFPGVKVTDIASLPQNIAYSLTSLGGGVAAGAPLAFTGPLAWGVGTAASGAVAYNMTAYQIMQQYLDIKNEEKIKRTGKGLTQAEEDMFRDEFNEKAMEYGLWEAVPEALSNLATVGLGKVAFVALKKPLTSIVGKLTAGKIIAGLAANYGQEFLTETVTQKKQAKIEYETKMRDEDINWVQAFKEVAPQTFLLSTIMAGAGSAIIKTSSAKTKILNSLDKEIPEDSPLKEEIKQSIEKGFQQVELAKETPVEPIKTVPQPLDKLDPRNFKTAEEYAKAQIDNEAFKVRDELYKGKGNNWRTVYHGTDSKSFDEIVKSGQLGRANDDITFFTTSKKEAKEYAQNKTKYRGGNRKPVVIEVQIPAGELRKGQQGVYSNEIEAVGILKFDPKYVDRESGYLGQARLDNEGIVATHGSGKTRSQLIEEWNKAVKTAPEAQKGTKVSGVAKTISQKAKKKGVEGVDLATYESSTIKEQERLMTEYFEQGGYENAINVLNGTSPVPAGVKPYNYLIELEKYINKNPKLENIPEILQAMQKSVLATEVSEAGSTLGLGQKVDKDGIVSKMNQIKAMRKERIGEAKIKKAKEIASEIAKSNYLSKEEANWDKFLKLLEC